VNSAWILVVAAPVNHISARGDIRKRALGFRKLAEFQVIFDDHPGSLWECLPPRTCDMSARLETQLNTSWHAARRDRRRRFLGWMS
jgi:hypothetical protein